MITLTPEQAQQIEEALIAYKKVVTQLVPDTDKSKRIALSFGTTGLHAIRAARALDHSGGATEKVEQDCGGGHHHRYAGRFGE